MSFEKWENDMFDSYYEDEEECCEEDGPDPDDVREDLEAKHGGTRTRKDRRTGRTIHELDFYYDPLRGK